MHLQRSKANRELDNWKYEYIKEMSRKYPSHIRDEVIAKKQKWTGIVYAFAIEFAKTLEGSIATGGDDLYSDIVQVLDKHSTWMPADENSKRKLYYIAGFLIRAVVNNAKQNISEDAIELFKSMASRNKEDAIASELPTDDVEKREVDNLLFASSAFFDVVIKLECVFHHILGEKSIEKFGPQIIADLEVCLNDVDIGINSLVNGCDDNDDVVNIRKRVIEAYCNMRGKDYVRQRRALSAFNFTESHRSTIGIIAKQAKDNAEIICISLLYPCCLFNIRSLHFESLNFISGKHFPTLPVRFPTANKRHERCRALSCQDGV